MTRSERPDHAADVKPGKTNRGRTPSTPEMTGPGDRATWHTHAN